MAAGDVKIVYGTAADITCTLASLASDTNLLTGRESNAVDNTSTLATDYLLSGKITTGTSPTASRQIQVWAVASWDNTTWPSEFDGTDSGETITAEVKRALLRNVVSMQTTSTSDFTYSFSGVSLASLFGGVCPPKFVIWVTHNTAVNLNATGSNHQLRVQPVYYNVAAA